MPMEFFLQILTLCSIPSAMTGLWVWLLQRSIKHRDKKRAEQEDTREHLEMHILHTSEAALILSKATAKAVQRIPSAKCNGDMHAALEEAEKIENGLHEFFMQQGVHNIIK